VARYKNPLTGKYETRSTGTRKKKEAERFAAKWESELQDGRYKAPSKVSWAEFRIRYEDEVLPGRAVKTGEKVAATFNAVERIVNPAKLATMNAERISYLQSKLREEGLAESTIKGHMAHLKAALRWAADIGLIAQAPKILMPKRTGAMKGRPITAEEFERMLDKVPAGLVGLSAFDGKQMAALKRERMKNLAPETLDSWRFLLRGLWWSGLRLGEALALDWNDDLHLCVDFDGRRPMFRIQAHAQKSHKAETLPMAPEFAEFLTNVSEGERETSVFNPKTRRPRKGGMRLDTVSKVISAIGKAAGVKVAESAKGKVKFASAHDLRRAFGFRWSNRIMPAQLQQLMRHEQISTTMEFYVGRNADATADVLWDAVGNTLGNTGPQTTIFDGGEKLKTVGTK
jgi:integrase